MTIFLIFNHNKLSTFDLSFLIDKLPENLQITDHEKDENIINNSETTEKIPTEKEMFENHRWVTEDELYLPKLMQKALKLAKNYN